MKDFYINHLHFQVGNGRGEFSTLITKEAVDEYSLANFGELPTSHMGRNHVTGIMAVKTVKYATNNNWRRMHGLKMLKRKIRRVEMALNEIAKHFYEKEVERLLGLDDVKIIKENFLDMRSQIDDLYVELGERARRIAELESENKEAKDKIHKLEVELAEKDAWFKIRGGLNAEPLPFSDEQYEEKTKIELPTMPIDVASMLINATTEYPTPSVYKVFGAGDTSFADKYSKSDLREIAEHLLVFCNNPDEDDDTQS